MDFLSSLMSFILFFFCHSLCPLLPSLSTSLLLPRLLWVLLLQCLWLLRLLLPWSSWPHRSLWPALWPECRKAVSTQHIHRHTLTLYEDMCISACINIHALMHIYIHPCVYLLWISKNPFKLTLRNHILIEMPRQNSSHSHPLRETFTPTHLHKAHIQTLDGAGQKTECIELPKL